MQGTGARFRPRIPSPADECGGVRDSVGQRASRRAGFVGCVGEVSSGSWLDTDFSCPNIKNDAVRRLPLSATFVFVGLAGDVDAFCG